MGRLIRVAVWEKVVEETLDEGRVQTVYHVQTLLANVLNSHLFTPLELILVLDIHVSVWVILLAVRQGTFELLKLECRSVHVIIEVVAELPDVDKFFELVS